MEFRKLLVIDQAPLLEDALGACHRACISIERLKRELLEHESRDLPAYDRWFHASFGRPLTEIRELAASLRDKEGALALARKRHWQRFFGSSCPIHSEESTLGRETGQAEYESLEEAELDETRPRARGRARWESFDDEEPVHAGSFYQAELLEEEDPFAEWFGSDESEGHDEFFVRDFDRRQRARNSRSRPGGGDEEESGFDDQARAYARFRARFVEEENSAEEARVETAGPAVRDALRTRLKDRYRALARKLHPDASGSLSEEEKSLWNQVQEAYGARDLEKLDLLVAIADAFTGKATEAAGVGQLRSAAREIERLMAPLRKRIDEAKRSRAWKFTELSDRLPLFKAIERELLREIARLRKTGGALDEQIARFTRRPKRGRDIAMSSSM